MIYFAHELNPSNPGDASCSPVKYFAFNDDTTKVSVSDLSNTSFVKNDVIVIGGGGLLNDMYIPVLRKLFLQTENIIFWGIGTNRHFWHGRIDSLFKQTILRTLFCYFEKLKFALTRSIYTSKEQDILSKVRLLGLRDYQSQFPCVPCPTCMHPIFDEVKNMTLGDQKIGVLGHNDFLKITRTSGSKVIPYIGRDIVSVVSDIAMCSKIITSSYHCAYWGMLLGKKVEIYSFSTKHLYLSQLHEKNKKSNLSFLEWCRLSNKNFFRKFNQII